METRYKNLSGDSGVIAYEIGDDFIWICFKGGSGYRYSNSSVGSHNVEKMKGLAEQGRGLSTFISQNRDSVYGKHDQTRKCNINR